MDDSQIIQVEDIRVQKILMADDTVKVGIAGKLVIPEDDEFEASEEPLPPEAILKLLQEATAGLQKQVNPEPETPHIIKPKGIIVPKLTMKPTNNKG